VDSTEFRALPILIACKHCRQVNRLQRAVGTINGWHSNEILSSPTRFALSAKRLHWPEPPNHGSQAPLFPDVKQKIASWESCLSVKATREMPHSGWFSWHATVFRYITR
jgi:hypothetical protein